MIENQIFVMSSGAYNKPNEISYWMVALTWKYQYKAGDVLLCRHRRVTFYNSLIIIYRDS